MNIFEEYFLRKSKELESEFDSSAIIHHAGTKGNNRETFIENFFNDIYPERYVVGNGEIIDSEGQISKQIDIAVYDDHLPVLEYGSSKHFLSEGVMAHIEIKSDLSTQLDDALDKSDSVKRLHRNINSSFQVGNIPTNPFSSVFAYDGPSKSTFKENILSYYDNNKGKLLQGVDLVCVLGKYLMVKYPIGGKTMEITEEDLQNAINTNQIVCVNVDGKFRFIQFIDSGENSLMLFTTYLVQAVHRNWLGSPNIQQYVDWEYDVF